MKVFLIILLVLVLLVLAFIAGMIVGTLLIPKVIAIKPEEVAGLFDSNRYNNVISLLNKPMEVNGEMVEGDFYGGLKKFTKIVLKNNMPVETKKNKTVAKKKPAKTKK